MKRRLFLILILLVLPFGARAETETAEGLFTSQTQIAIGYQKIDWQTYEFSVAVNDPATKIARYEWRVDGGDFYTGERFQYVFARGRHVIDLRVFDAKGGLRGEQVTLNISFWSFGNMGLWWILYGFLILLILYYWIIKLLYQWRVLKGRAYAKHVLKTMDEEDWEAQIQKKIKRNLL